MSTRPSQYSFTNYSVNWPAEFRQEAARLESLLGGELIAVHHIGSTSVPGLAAKPIIDLLPVVGDIGQIDRSTPVMQNAGYRVWGENGLSGRRFFTRDRGTVRTHNLHFYQSGHPDVQRHLAFCAYLRSHPVTRDEYAALKQDAFARHPADIAAYSAAKDDWIKRVERIAAAWYRARAE